MSLQFMEEYEVFTIPFTGQIAHGGRQCDLAASIEECFNNYTDATRKILGFDKYKDISAKDNERMWRASEVVNDYDLSIARHLDRCKYEKHIQ